MAGCTCSAFIFWLFRLYQGCFVYFHTESLHLEYVTKECEDFDVWIAKCFMIPLQIFSISVNFFTLYVILVARVGFLSYFWKTRNFRKSSRWTIWRSSNRRSITDSVYNLRYRTYFGWLRHFAGFRRWEMPTDFSNKIYRSKIYWITAYGSFSVEWVFRWQHTQ